MSATSQPKQKHLLPLTIRPYEARDFECIFRIDQSCYQPGIAYSRFDLRMFQAEPGAAAWVADEGTSLAGFILMQRVSRDVGHVITLDVREDRRRCGIGRALLAAAEAGLQEQGVQWMFLETAADNHAAIAFWKKAGYVMKGILPLYYLDRDDAYRMEKELA